MTYFPAESRYDQVPYRRLGYSGLKLPAVSLGLWHNFGDDKPFETQRAVLRRAFDLGVTHFDLANNYGPPAGSAETNFGRHLRDDFRPYRDELIISSKAGYLMWDGPYGEWGSRKNLLSSLDQSLSRMGLEYVDIFYSHRFDPETPLEETMGALDTAVRSGRALYVGVSNYSASQTVRAAKILRELGTPMVINQPNYHIFDRWIEAPDESGSSLLRVLKDEGIGSIAYSPLAQGVLTDRYLNGVPADSRAAVGHFLKESALTEEKMTAVRSLNEIAGARGQSLAEMAVAWVLREQHDGGITSALVGASSVAQLEANLAGVRNLEFSAAEIAAIDTASGSVGSKEAK
ncbi:oxidoreductase [Renibacterium salmoninarum ATCC 33209]|uniref:Oxidoreductase n=1 Tax=Renibacterium salmoninarum (strain ATCC 33209 / DSM 20767 / JCM 11484 / NBRC 15589 / NCIMB 2235) TaxID=288705 RepID=A9WMW8_RENSM|nr:aldo/keto reductase [Renibacterium salmoninarum]ABY23451.1 oxidoreductase [Renibacterium salmoninarum ATCC 33209]